MRHPTVPLMIALVVLFFGPAEFSAWGQPATPEPTATAAKHAATPEAGITSPRHKPKELQGLDVFGSEGQLIGKIAAVNVFPDGNVKDVEIQSRGFLGLFAKTYVVPSDKLTKKGGRVDLSMTSEQAKQLAK
jgi:PRC-barrel domain